MTEHWVQRYRADHPAAAEWARGSSKVRHSVETQDRVFRMAEQIRANRTTPDVGRLFSMLKAVDAVVDAETFENARPSPSSAAAAAVVGFKMLFGTLPPVRDHDWPTGFERVDEGETMLASRGLQAQGFDPIMLDGIDPAAYLWALFEMRERQAACAEVIRLGQHPASEPRCLAVIPEQPIRRPLPEKLPVEQPRELVGVGR